MRKIIVLSMITLDGVLQAPGDPQEDPAGGFRYGGWTAYWPNHEEGWPGVNRETKYVVSNTPTRHEWRNSVFLKGNIMDEIRKLKGGEGPDLHVYGSGNLIQTLLKHDLVDEFRLRIFPITLGTGKRLFSEGTIPAAFKLTDSTVSPEGVIIANYQRAGEVQTGSFS